MCACACVFVGFLARSTHDDAGHELRNPLHGVCAGVKALQDGTLSAEEARREVSSIAEGVGVLVSVANDMTDLQKLRSGHFTVHPVPTRLRAVLEGCILAMQSAVERPTDIRLEYGSCVPGEVCMCVCVCVCV